MSLRGRWLLGFHFLFSDFDIFGGTKDKPQIEVTEEATTNTT